MNKIEIACKITKGKLEIDAQNIRQYLSLLDDGTYVLTLQKNIPPKSIEEYRAQYFAMRDIVASESGNTKAIIHEGAKIGLLEGTSTTLLDGKGWKEFIRKFKEWSYEYFNVYI